MNHPPILIVENVEKHFGDLAVLRGINASVAEGSITAFVGPNGAGKTTLFHTITGDLAPDRGTVLFRGRPITAKAPWKVARCGLGKLFQDVRLFESLTILENVILALHEHSGRSVAASLWHSPFRNKADQALLAEAERWLEKAGVERPYDRPAGLLSFGNKKLLALARLMAGKFDLLLLDEPAAGVSPPMIVHIAKLLQDLVRERGVTIALIEHNFAFVSRVAERVYVLRAGVVHDHGQTAEVLGREENREILIGL
jgi:ABC-type branched-subunit amino acid transport system ATPase component